MKLCTVLFFILGSMHCFFANTDTSLVLHKDTNLQFQTKELKKYIIEIPAGNTEKYITQLKGSKASYVIFELDKNDVPKSTNDLISKPALTKRILNNIPLDSNLQYVFTEDQARGLCFCERCQNRIGDDTIKLSPHKKYVLVILSKESLLSNLQ